MKLWSRAIVRGQLQFIFFVRYISYHITHWSNIKLFQFSSKKAREVLPPTLVPDFDLWINARRIGLGWLWSLWGSCDWNNRRQT